MQAPYYTASHHRYSSAFNNPLKYTDPSGLTALYVEQINSQSNLLSGFGGLGRLNRWAGFQRTDDSFPEPVWPDERNPGEPYPSRCFACFNADTPEGAGKDDGESGYFKASDQLFYRRDSSTVLRPIETYSEGQRVQVGWERVHEIDVWAAGGRARSPAETIMEAFFLESWKGALFGAAGRAGGFLLGSIGRSAPAAKYITPQVAKIEKQLIQHGRSSVEKSLRSLEARLAEHRSALETYRAEGGYTSSVEREIRAFESEIQAIIDVLGRGP